MLPAPAWVATSRFNQPTTASVAGRVAPRGGRTSQYDLSTRTWSLPSRLDLAQPGGQVARADGLLFATPEYNQSLPGVMKNVVDWLSRPPQRVLDGKPVATIGATVGIWGTRFAQRELRQVLTATGSLVLPAPAVYLRDAPAAFDDAGRLADREGEELSRLLAAFAGWIERMR